MAPSNRSRPADQLGVARVAGVGLILIAFVVFGSDRRSGASATASPIARRGESRPSAEQEDAGRLPGFERFPPEYRSRQAISIGSQM